MALKITSQNRGAAKFLGNVLARILPQVTSPPKCAVPRLVWRGGDTEKYWTRNLKPQNSAYKKQYEKCYVRLSNVPFDKST